jgi:Flp pilus assembly protein TadG
LRLQGNEHPPGVGIERTALVTQPAGRLRHAGNDILHDHAIHLGDHGNYGDSALFFQTDTHKRSVTSKEKVHCHRNTIRPVAIQGSPCGAAFACFLCREMVGVSAVEFALVSPILILILAGMVDIGASLKGKFDLSSAISAGSNYALLNGDKVNSTGGDALARNIIAVASSGLNSAGGSVQVVINNGASVVLDAGKSTITETGTLSNSDLCYCPTSSGHTVTWGASVTCGTVCPNSGISGKFVTISASKPFSPLFGGFGIVTSGNISVRAVVQPK